MALLVALKKNERGQAAIELALLTPLFVVFLVAIAELTLLVMRTQGNVTMAEKRAAQAILAREGFHRPVEKRPCLEEMTEKRWVVDGGGVTVMRSKRRIPEEVTVVTEEICRD